MDLEKVRDYSQNGRHRGLTFNAKAAEELMKYIFDRNGWEPYTQIHNSTGTKITLVPLFDKDVDNKSEKTCKGFKCVDDNGREIPKLRANTLGRFLSQLYDYSINADGNLEPGQTIDDEPIDIVCTLKGAFGKSIKNNTDIQDTIKKLQHDVAGQPELTLVRIANNARNYENGKKITNIDPTAIEVRPKGSDVSLGWLPKNLPEKDRIARYLVSHKPYLATVHNIRGGFKKGDGSIAPYSIKVHIQFPRPNEDEKKN